MITCSSHSDSSGITCNALPSSDGGVHLVAPGLGGVMLRVRVVRMRGERLRAGGRMRKLSFGKTWVDG